MNGSIGWTVAAAALALAPVQAAQANDSAAAIGLGGIELTRNSAISMDSEDLYISRAEVRVRYRYTNHSNRDIDTLVSFPVPEVPDGIDGYYVDTAEPDYHKLDFHTTIDGKPAELDYIERAEVRGRDVTARIAALGWPLRWFDEGTEPISFVDKLTAAQRAQYTHEGLLKQSEYGDTIPAWNLVAHVTRHQVFPAGRTIEVTHRYVPIVGGAVGGYLDRRARAEPDFVQHARQYCMDQSFLSGFDRAQAASPANADGEPVYSEVWISYILLSGANWRGPIGQFHLVVDKGAPDNLVSFCMDGVRKISPTQFEVTKTNFEPTKNLDVLIVEWLTPGEQRPFP